ncbi:MAG TPA: hypothetical protein VMV96_06430 [Acidimicrobiales bacterium]|nr:hypothetical protein [Acidimicrobiales bacterium]
MHRYLVLLGLMLIALTVAWVFVASVRIGFVAHLRRALRIPSLDDVEKNRWVGGLRRGLERIASYETLILTTMVLIFAVTSVVEGTDRTYDLLNYHFVNGFFALHPGNHNIGVSGIQGFFNPLVDAPTYLAYHYLPPWGVLFGFGLIQGLAFPVIYKIARSFDFGRLLSYFAAGCGLFSAISMSEMGFSLGDSTLVPLILLGLLVVIRATPMPKTKTPFIVGGALIGIAVGLKLTAAPYLFGLLLFVWFYVVKGEKVRSAVLTIIGGAIGGAISYGWWAWHLFQDYRNPFFPMYNQYFHSPYAVVGLNNGVDDRVKNLGQLLFFSYEIMIHPLRTGAGVLRDYGFPIIETLLLVALAWWLYRSLRTRKVQQVFNRRETRALVAFYLATYLVWVYTTGIFRYMVGLEMFSFLMIAVLLRDLAITLNYQRVVPYAVATCFAAISLTQLSPIWYPRIPAVSTQFSVNLPAMLSAPDTSVIFADGSPNSWIVPSLPTSDFVARVFNWQITPTMASLIQSRVAAKGSPVVVWTDLSTIPVVNSRLLKINLQVDPKNCVTFQGTAGGIVQTFAACRATTLGGG